MTKGAVLQISLGISSLALAVLAVMTGNGTAQFRPTMPPRPPQPAPLRPSVGNMQGGMGGMQGGMSGGMGGMQGGM